MESTLVIKVQYEDTLRRFNARVIDNENLDLDMPRLKAKIFSLFDIPPGTDVTLTYIDEDGDIVTLVDDDDLRDVMKQQLKFLKIFVNTERSARSYARSSGASTPLRSPRVQPPIPNLNAVVAEAMKSVPEALHGTLTRMSEDFLSKATSSSPSIADLLEQLAKMGLGQPSSNPVPPTAPASSASPSAAADGMNEATKQPGKAAIDSSSKGDLPAEFVAAARCIVRPPSSSVQLPIDLNALPPVNSSSLSDMKESHKDVKSASQGQVGGKTDGSSSSTATAEAAAVPQGNSSQIAGFTGSSVACPFSGLPLPSGMLPHMHRNKRGCKPADVAGGVFHRGIRCDGCGVHPITGPRYKSLVKDDYDLCSICFAEIGREGDYVRIERPISYRHMRGIKTPGFQQQPWVPPMPGQIFPIPQPRPGVRRGHPKLDSRFVSDVTVMDGTVMAPSTPFTKIWRMRNNGNFVWVAGTRLVWIGGDNFSNQESLEVQIPPEGVPVDEELDVAVDFVAPPSPGRYISYWRMASPSGHKFGQRVWVLVQVDGSVNESSDKGAINLNLPPEAIGNILQEMNSSQTAGAVDDSSAEPTAPLAQQQGERDLEQNFPINDALLVGSVASASAPPETSSSNISYPTIDQYDGVEAVASAPAPAPATPGEVAAQPSETDGAEVDAVEQNLLKELAQMGFKQVDLNKEVLRMNSYDLQQSVDDLCGVSDWDPILEELQEMGFCDREMNKRLLKKNDGRISRVVADLLTGEKA